MTIRQITLQVDTEKLTDGYRSSHGHKPVEVAAYLYPLLVASLGSDRGSMNVINFFEGYGITVVDEHEDLEG